MITIQAPSTGCADTNSLTKKGLTYPEQPGNSLNPMELSITVFAQLKDHFEPKFTIQTKDDALVNDALEVLINQKPHTKELILGSKVAINEEIVSTNQPLKAGASLFLLPPSSGG